MLNSSKMGLYTYQYFENLKYQEDVKKLGKEIKSLLKKIPLYIRKNGIHATIVFLEGKCKEQKSKKQKISAEEVILNYFKDYINEESIFFGKKNITDNFSEWVLRLEIEKNIYLTQEILSLTVWGIRLAESILPSDEYKEEDSDAS